MTIRKFAVFAFLSLIVVISGCSWKKEQSAEPSQNMVVSSASSLEKENAATQTKEYLRKKIDETKKILDQKVEAELSQDDLAYCEIEEQKVMAELNLFLANKESGGR